MCTMRNIILELHMCTIEEVVYVCYLLLCTTGYVYYSRILSGDIAGVITRDANTPGQGNIPGLTNTEKRQHEDLEPKSPCLSLIRRGRCAR